MGATALLVQERKSAQSGLLWAVMGSSFAIIFRRDWPVCFVRLVSETIYIGLQMRTPRILAFGFGLCTCKARRTGFGEGVIGPLVKVNLRSSRCRIDPTRGLTGRGRG